MIWKDSKYLGKFFEELRNLNRFVIKQNGSSCNTVYTFILGTWNLKKQNHQLEQRNHQLVIPHRFTGKYLSSLNWIYCNKQRQLGVNLQRGDYIIDKIHVWWHSYKQLLIHCNISLPTFLYISLTKL